MASNDEILENYVKRLMDVQYGMEEEKPLTDDELKEIALQMGMSEAEYENSKRRANDHYERGKIYVQKNNYADAVNELNRAVTLHPNHVEANYMLGKALMHHGLLNEDQESLDRADLYLSRTLKINRIHEGALTARTQLRKGKSHQKTVKGDRAKNKKRIMYGIVGAVILILIITHISITNSMGGLSEATDQSWAQVENVYQRRADLIPNLVKTVNAAADHEKEMMEIATFTNTTHLTGDDINEENIQKYLEQQEKLSQRLDAILITGGSSATENYLSLQDAIEGSENRIAVERKRFNEAVEAYNSKCVKFPYSLYGYQKKPYYRMKPGSDQTPELDL